MKLKIDLHVHTNASGDGISPIEDVLRYAKKRGLDGIAITDHDVFMDPVIAERLSGEVLVIPGIELTTEMGHLIFLCDENGPMIIPHPLDPMSHGIGSKNVKNLANSRPLLEVRNGSTIPIFNRMAEKLAIELNLNMVGGSDAHVDFMVGSAYTVVDAEEKSLDDVVEAIRMGRVRAIGGMGFSYIKYIAKKSLIKLRP